MRRYALDSEGRAAWITPHEEGALYKVEDIDPILRDLKDRAEKAEEKLDGFEKYLTQRLAEQGWSAHYYGAWQGALAALAADENPAPPKEKADA